MYHKLVYILLFFLTFEKISAQQINHVGLDDGLSSGFVYDFMQSSTGFMYIGLNSGLNRYDGYEIVHYKHNPFDDFSISPHAVNSIAEDSRGYIWIGFESGELDVFNPKSQRFHHLGSFGQQNNKHHLVIQEVFVDPNDNIWVALLSGKAIKLELPMDFNLVDKPASIPYQPMVAHEIQIDKNPNFEPEHEPGRNPIRYFKLDAQDRLWMVSYDAQLFKIDWKNNSHELVHQAKERKLRYEAQFFEFPDGTFLFYAGVKWQKITGQKIEELTLNPWFNDFRFHAYDDEGYLIYSLKRRDLNGRLEGQKIIYYRCNLSDLQSEQPKVDSLFSHKRTPNTKLLIDQSGLYWAKSNIGLITYNPNAKIFRQTHKDISVYHIVHDKNGYLWAKDGESYEFLYNLKTHSTSLSHDVYPALKFQFHGKVLCRKDSCLIGFCLKDEINKTPSLRNPTIILYNPKTDELSEYNFKENTKIMEGGLKVLDQNDKLWALKDSEFFRLDLEKKESKAYSISNEKRKIRHIWAYVDTKNQIWSATVLGALRINIDQYPERKPSFIFFNNDPTDKYSLSHNSIKCYHDDPFEPHKYIWIGTAGGGLNRMDRATKQCVHYTTLNSNIPDDVVYQIQADTKGNLWLSTNKGLSRFTIQSETFKNYTKEDGLQSLEFNTGSSLRLPDGEMIFGGINGINYFNPDKDNMEGNRFIPNVHLTDIKINNKDVDVYPFLDSLDFHLEQSIEHTKSLDLSYKQNNLRLEFAALDFTQKKQSEYRYRLTEGSARKKSSEEDWVDLGTENKVQFISLNPGDYLFEVIGSNQDQAWNETPRTLTFTIHPPWWKTDWAYSCYASLILGVLWLAYRFQLDKITIDRNAKKEFAEALIFAQEEERKRIARDLHDGLGQSLLLIGKEMNKTKAISMEYQVMISETLEEVRSISRDLHPYQLDQFGLTNSIQNIIDKIKSTTNIFISFEIDNIDQAILAKSEIHLYRTIQEVFNNIVKHAAATAAKVIIKNKGKAVVITIQDNGKGFDHELTIVKSKSLGLRTMYERISAIDGHLDIEKGEPTGTLIRIRIPKV